MRLNLDMWNFHGSTAFSIFRIPRIPYGNQTWLAGKSLINQCFSRNITRKWSFSTAMFDDTGRYSQSLVLHCWCGLMASVMFPNVNVAVKGIITRSWILEEIRQQCAGVLWYPPSPSYLINVGRTIIKHPCSGNADMPDSPASTARFSSSKSYL